MRDSNGRVLHARRACRQSARASAIPVALAAMLLCHAGGPGAAGSAGGPGLDLRRDEPGPLLPVPVEATIDNPHAMACVECHLDPGPGSAGPLRGGGDSVSLCEGCHEGSNLHPVGMRPSPGGVPPAALPLGTGPLEGRITCLTCHELHRPPSEPYRRHLLRSLDRQGGDRKQGLCAACHGTKLKERSPHAAGGKHCRLCHLSEPRAGGERPGVSAAVQAACNFCHDALENRHYLALNPFNDEYLSFDISALDIPRPGGGFSCISCHDPHAGEGRRTKLLRPAYLALAAASKKINPHWKNVMCDACHEGEARKGSPSLREGGDFIRLCYRCHAFKYSRSDIHPVNVRPSASVTIPEDMPLQNGRLTCGTCHDSSLQEGGEQAGSAGRENPKFLRGGFTTRNEFCFRCHPAGLLGRLNPHRQLDPLGGRIETACLFCHTSIPEGTAGWLVVQRQFGEKAVNDLCLLCHPASYREGHPIGPHLGTPSRGVERALETSEERIGIQFLLVDGAVVCITCHNPHQEGVVERKAGVRPASEVGLRVGREICQGCHPGD